jgi:putative MFS transporter
VPGLASRCSDKFAAMVSVWAQRDAPRHLRVKAMGAIDPDDAPLSFVHVLIVIGSALGFTFDLAEMAFGSAIAGVFSAPPYSIAPGLLSWLLAATYIGAVAGPPLAGAFADRRGRRAALAATLFGMAITSFLSAFSPGLLTLAICRVLAGITLGAFPPLMITYLTDALPARLRGPLTMVTVGVAYLGPPALIFAMRWLTPIAPFGFEAWRCIILLSGIGALGACAVFFYLPESGRWQRATRSIEAACVVANEQTDRERFPLMATLFFLAPWAGVAFPVLTAALLLHKGFALSDSLFYVGFSTFGPCVGAVLAGLIADRIERRNSLALCGLGMVAATFGFCISNLPLVLMLTSFAFGVLISLYIPALYLYSSELASTRIRGRFMSWLWSINRTAAAISLLALLPLLHEVGIWPVFMVIAGTLLAGVVIIIAFGPPGTGGQRVS